MKTLIKNGTINLALALGLAGCRHAPEEMRRSAAQTLNCRERDLSFESSGDGFRANGCGREAVFVEVSAVGCSDFRDTVVHSKQGWVPKDQAAEPCRALGFSTTPPSAFQPSPLSSPPGHP